MVEWEESRKQVGVDEQRYTIDTLSSIVLTARVVAARTVLVVAFVCCGATSFGHSL